MRHPRAQARYFSSDTTGSAALGLAGPLSATRLLQHVGKLDVVRLAATASTRRRPRHPGPCGGILRPSHRRCGIPPGRCPSSPSADRSPAPAEAADATISSRTWCTTWGLLRPRASRERHSLSSVSYFSSMSIRLRKFVVSLRSLHVGAEGFRKAVEYRAHGKPGTK